MHEQSNTIRIERFKDKKNIKRDWLIVFAFIALYIVVGLFEENLFLPDNGLGLLEHINIWIFLVSNLLIPLIIYYAFNSLEHCIDSSTIAEIKKTFKNIAEHKTNKILLNFSTAIGFCCFVGNSLQNAKIINPLPFDYWDSIDYIISYIVSRVHKFYLFAYFLPLSFTYIVILIRTISNLLMLHENDMKRYPLIKYDQLNTLCDFGLNILLVLVIPFFLSSCGVYFVHERFDITSITTIIISIAGTFVCFGTYLFLIKNFYANITIYKKINIKKINFQLSKIHQYILNNKYENNRYEKLEIYLKKEEYLIKTKEKIEEINKFPHIVKAIFTSIIPIIPTLMQYVFQFLNTFFKLEILENIL